MILDMSAVAFLDATGVDALAELLLAQPFALRLLLADPGAPVLATLLRAGVLAKLGALLS